MKKFLKLKAALLSLAMLVASVPGVYAEGAVNATDGYFWLEAENCSDKHMSWDLALSDGATTNAVSGSGWGISQTANPGADGYYIDFTINVEEAVSYDIYVYGGRVANTAWVSAGKIKINGTDIEAQPVHYSHDDWGKMGSTGDINLGWSKATVAIAEGEQVLRYYINDVVTGNNTTYQGALDLICVVPSDYGWTPSGTGKTSVKPVAPVYNEFTNGYLWLEAEQNVDAEGNFSTITDGNDLFTDGKALMIKTDPGVVGETKHSLKYLIDVPVAGKYDININGTGNGIGWVSPIKVDIDGISYENLTALGAAKWYGDWGCKWNTVEAELTAGKHIMTVYTDAKAPDSEALFRMIVDAICIVPADWSWTPSITTKPVAPKLFEFTNGYLWAEGEDASKKNGLSAKTHTNLSNESSSAATAATLPTDGYYADFIINVPADDNYVVYFRGTYDDGTTGGQWSSNPMLKVDGAEKTSEASGTAAWWDSYYGGWRKSEAVSLSAGKHTVRWGFDEIRRGDKNYVGLIDAICIIPADWDWTPSITTKPVAPTYIDYAWFEAEEAQTKYGTLTTFSDTCVSNDSALKVMTGTAPTGIGYGVGFDVFMNKAGDYDLYIYGGFEHQWSSASILYANGENCDNLVTLNLTDGWHSSLPCKWQKTSATLAEGKNSIDWVINNQRTSSNEDTNKYAAVFDTLVIVPAGTPFNPPKTYNNTIEDHDVGAAAAKADYELAVLLANYDLANVKSDLVLPTATVSGKTVTWTTSNSQAITQDGEVIRSTASDVTVTLTATCGDATKEFAATVKMIKEYDVDGFAVSGTIAAGNKISARANVKYNLTGSKEVMLIVAVYSKDGKLLAVDLDKKDATSEGISLAAEATVPNDADLTDAYARGYLWNGIGDLKPIENAINL